MTKEEKTERNRAKKQSKKDKKIANKAKAADSDADAPPPPAAHPQKRDAKPARKSQVNNSIPQLCWYFQGYHNGGRVCENYTKPKVCCKYTHRGCYNATEFKSLTIPPEVLKATKDNERSVLLWVLMLLIARLNPRLLETVGTNPVTKVRARVDGLIHLAAKARVRVKTKVKARKAIEKARKATAKANAKELPILGMKDIGTKTTGLTTNFNLMATGWRLTGRMGGSERMDTLGSILRPLPTPMPAKVRELNSR